MTTRIAFAGKAGAGKTTIALKLAKKLHCPVYKFAGRLYEIVNSLQREAGVPIQKDRYALQTIGMIMRKYDPDFFVKHTLREATGAAIIDDLRFPNEYKALKEAGFICIRLMRDTGDSDAAGHISEVALDNYDLPEIDNNGTIEETLEQIEQYLSTL